MLLSNVESRRMNFLLGFAACDAIPENTCFFSRLRHERSLTVFTIEKKVTFLSISASLVHALTNHPSISCDMVLLFGT